jgi:UDP-N-acetylglucosamine acyltransferase
VAGHVVIGNRVTVGGLVGIHQFVRVGDFAMIGAGSMVAKDVPPFSIAQGDRAALVGVNKIGLERAGFSDEEITEAKILFRRLFLGSGAWHEKLTNLNSIEQLGVLGKLLLNFVNNSERGVCALRSKSTEEPRM